MKRSIYLVLTALILGAVLLTACGGGGSSNGTEEADVRPTPPTEYASKTNPLKGNAQAADAGKTVFATNCASCHGDTGHGDGAAGAALDPKPDNLVNTVAQTSEPYMFWRISEGGWMEPFKSSMPAWKGVLSEEQIWQVITYIETLK